MLQLHPEQLSDGMEDIFSFKLITETPKTISEIEVSVTDIHVVISTNEVFKSVTFLCVSGEDILVMESNGVAERW